MGDASECNSVDAQRGVHSVAVCATSCGFKIALTSDRRHQCGWHLISGMTTIRLINVGLEMPPIYSYDDRGDDDDNNDAGSAGKRGEREKN